MSETVLLNIEDKVANIIFNRPQQMNSFDGQMAADLAAITTDIKHNQQVKVVVLKGEGPLFMAGGDIQYFHHNLEDLPQHVQGIMELVNQSLYNLMTMDKIVLACVHGSAAGIGMSFVSAADLAIAGSQTKFTTAYAKIGISPDGGMTYSLPRQVGYKKAMAQLLFADLISAEDAVNLGLINWAVPEAELHAFSEKIIKQIILGPQDVQIKVKSLLRSNEHHSLEEQLALEAKYFSEQVASDNFKQGISAFLNKQQPVFE